MASDIYRTTAGLRAWPTRVSAVEPAAGGAQDAARLW